MADVNRGNRPLSPHLQIYKLPLTAKLSILHRISGVALAGSGLLLTVWFVSGAFWPECFAWADWLLHSWFGKAISIVSLFGLFFHFCTGIRHIFWDLGYGFSLAAADRSNYYVLGGAVSLTVLALIAIAI